MKIVFKRCSTLPALDLPLVLPRLKAYTDKYSGSMILEDDDRNA